MKSDSWIDQVYKSTEKAPPSLNMSHWHAAEVLIIAQENEKKKKRFLFWILMTGILLLSIAVGYGFYQNTKEVPTPHPAIKSPVEQTPTAASSPPMASIEKSTSENDKNSTIPLSKNTISNDQLIAKTNADVKLRNSAPNTISINSNNNSTSKSRTNSVQKNMSNLNVNESTGFKLVEENTTDLMAKNDEIPMNKNSRIKYSTDLINNPYIELNYSLSTLTLPSSTDWSVAPIQVKKYHWREKGIRASLAQELNPYSNYTEISNAAIEYFYQKSISSILFYGMSVGYKSNFNKSRYAQVLTSLEYKGFSSEIRNFGIKPEWIQTISSQLNIGLERKRNRWFLGVSPDIVFASKGQVNQIEFKEPNAMKVLEKAIINDLNRGWLETNILNKLVVSGFLAYDVKVNKSLSVGLQINHIVRSPYKPLSGDFTQRNLSKWNSGFRLSYLLN